MTQRMEPIAQRVASTAMENFPRPENLIKEHLRSWISVQNSGSYVLQTFHIVEQEYGSISCLPHYCMLCSDQKSWLLSFTELQIKRHCTWEGLCEELYQGASFTHTQIKLRWLPDLQWMLIETVKRISFSSSNKSDAWHQYNLTCFIASNI